MQHFSERLQMSSHNHRGLYYVLLERSILYYGKKVLVQYIFLSKIMIPGSMHTIYVLDAKKKK